MPLNLVQHRSSSNVWDSAAVAQWDVERWVAAIVAGGCLALGLRQRSARGLLLVAAGAGLAWWAASGAERRRHRRGRLLERLPTAWRSGDHAVSEASEESFPASDAPSWTSTTGNTAKPTAQWE